jgi:hypothetical protein
MLRERFLIGPSLPSQIMRQPNHARRSTRHQTPDRKPRALPKPLLSDGRSPARSGSKYPEVAKLIAAFSCHRGRCEPGTARGPFSLGSIP